MHTTASFYFHFLAQRNNLHTYMVPMLPLLLLNPVRQCNDLLIQLQSRLFRCNAFQPLFLGSPKQAFCPMALQVPVFQKLGHLWQGLKLFAGCLLYVASFRWMLFRQAFVSLMKPSTLPFGTQPRVSCPLFLCIAYSVREPLYFSVTFFDFLVDR